MIINNESIRDTFYCVITIQTTLHKELSQVNYNKSHLDKLVPDYLANTFSKKHDKALQFVDDITRTAYENGVVALVSTFERVAFAKYRTTYGKIKTIINNEVDKPIDYYASRERFVNTSLDRLAHLMNLLEGIIDSNLYSKLNELKFHRNYIAHGKRDVEAPTKEYTIEEIAKILDDIILEIEK